MALTQTTILDAITILENGLIHVRYGRKILDDDGVTEITRTYSRATFPPATDRTTVPAGPVRAVANLVWTPAVVSAYLASLPVGPP